MAKRKAAPGLPPVELYGAILNENGLKQRDPAFVLYRTVHFISEYEWRRLSKFAAAGICFGGEPPRECDVVYRDEIGPQAPQKGDSQ